jgi:hypothetical protein
MAEINEQLSVWAGLFGFGEVRTTAGILASVIEVVAFAVLTASDCSCPGRTPRPRRISGARFWQTGRAVLSCRPSRLRAVHDVGDRSDEEPYPAHALTLRLTRSGITLKVVKRVTPVRDLLRAAGPGSDAQVALDRVLPGNGH